MNPTYDFIIASDDKHEKVFIEIYYQGKFVALINQEKGVEHLEIEMPGNQVIETLVQRIIPLNDFVELVEEAAKKLSC